MTHSTTTTSTHAADRAVERPAESRITAGVAWAAAGLAVLIVLAGLDAIAYGAYVDPWGWNGLGICLTTTSPLATVVVAALVLALAVSG